jgi:hypothetical protein
MKIEKISLGYVEGFERRHVLKLRPIEAISVPDGRPEPVFAVSE